MKIRLLGRCGTRGAGIVIMFVFGVVFLAQPTEVEARVYSKNLVINSGFNRTATVYDDWNCDITTLYYSFFCSSATASFDLGQRKNDGNYFALGRRSSTGTVGHSLSQTFVIPEDAYRAKLHFEYQLQTTDSGPFGSYDDYDFFGVYFHNNPKEHGDEMNERLEDFFYVTSKDPKTKWTQKSFDVSNWIGERAKLFIHVDNRNENISQAYLDNVVVRVQTKSKVIGIVKNGNGKLVKYARVTVKNKKGKTLWKGKTGKKGKFVAKGLKGSPVARRIFVSKNGVKNKYIQRVKWGKKYERKFKFTKQ